MTDESEQLVTDTQEAAVPTKAKRKTPRKWQERLLPVMVGLLIGLTIFFFGVTFVQMSYLHSSMLQIPALNLQSLPDNDMMAGATTFADKATARRLEILAKLESYLIERRYHQASALLMSGLWIRYLGFVTGMILAMVGASFVLGKLQESGSEVAGKSSLIDFSVKSASPGIILAVLGVVLMFTTIVDRDEFTVKDSRIYLPDTALPAATVEPPPELLELLGTPGK
jgi:hypothetical protein